MSMSAKCGNFVATGDPYRNDVIWHGSLQWFRYFPFTLPHSSALAPKIAKTSGGVAVADSECIWQILTARKMRQKQLKHIKTTVKLWKIQQFQQGLEIFAVAPEGDFLFLRHHNRFGDGVNRHGGSRSGHGSWGWRSGSTLWCCGRNRFQMVSVTIWGQHHQWIINESSICLQSWEIWEMPPVHTGDWLLNAVKLPHECYVCQILYGWSRCSETNLYRYHQKHPQSPKKKGMARNYRKCVCKKNAWHLVQLENLLL